MNVLTSFRSVAAPLRGSRLRPVAHSVGVAALCDCENVDTVETNAMRGVDAERGRLSRTRFRSGNRETKSGTVRGASVGVGRAYYAHGINGETNTMVR